MRRFLTIPLVVSALAAAMAVSAPTCFASHAVVRVSTSGGIDRAVRAAEAKGPGATVYFKAGAYNHARMNWPNGINLRGDGIGKTKLNFAVRFGSRSRIGGRLQSMGLTMGSTTASTEFELRDGAHGTQFRVGAIPRPRSRALGDLRLHPPLARQSGARHGERSRHRLGGLPV